MNIIMLVIFPTTSNAMWPSSSIKTYYILNTFYVTNSTSSWTVLNIVNCRNKAIPYDAIFDTWEKWTTCFYRFPYVLTEVCCCPFLCANKCNAISNSILRCVYMRHRNGRTHSILKVRDKKKWCDLIGVEKGQKLDIHIPFSAFMFRVNDSLHVLLFCRILWSLPLSLSLSLYIYLYLYIYINSYANIAWDRNRWDDGLVGIRGGAGWKKRNHETRG